jgi:hypothetical protein
MEANKTIIWLLILYILFQLASIFFKNFLFLIAYPLVYLIAVVYSIMTVKRSLKSAGKMLLYFFRANLILFLIYVPTVLLNPNINWRLKGEAEVDPMLLQVYVPAVFFVFALIAVLLGFCINKWMASYMAKKKKT